MAGSLGPGDIRTGQLVDGLHDAEPIPAATLTDDEAAGVLLRVPFVRGHPQFAKVSSWFGKAGPPNTLIFQDNVGDVTLVDVQFRGQSGAALVTGRLGADVTFFGRPRRLKPSYRLQGFASSIDGLEDFAGFRPVQMNDGPAREPVVVTVEHPPEVTWRHGGFSYAIVSGAPWTATLGRSFEVRSEPFIRTTSSRRADANQHLTAQWPIRALLLLAHGSKLAWRWHRSKDAQFPVWMLSGDAHDPAWIDVTLQRTASDAHAPAPERSSVAMPMLRLSDLGAKGMRRWCELYADDLFRRAVEPAVEVINGASRFLEPQIMMLALALDAMGYYRRADRTKRWSLARHIELCMTEAKLDWPQIGTRRAISEAIAKANNDIKHPDRDQRPDHLTMSLLRDLAVVIFRAQIFDLLKQPKSVRTSFLRSNDVYRAVGAFELNNARVAADGSVAVTATEPDS